MSAIGAINRQFSISMGHNSAFSQQQGASASRSLAASGGGSMDEVSYAALNDSEKDFDISMLQDSLDYEFYKNMSDKKDDK